MTEADLDASGIVNMDAAGNVITDPDPDRDPTMSPAEFDPPGIRRAFVDDDDPELNEQLRELRAHDLDLSAHEGHTREAQRERVDEIVAWAKGRIPSLDADFAETLDRTSAAYPNPEHATMRMMADPAWAKGVRKAIDAKGRSDHGVPPTRKQVSCYSQAELTTMRANLRSEIAEREHELRMRERRRDTYRAQQAERQAKHPAQPGKESEMTDQATVDGLAALGREAQQRERDRRQAADAEAVETMTHEQIEAARWFRLSPSEWLYWHGRK